MKTSDAPKLELFAPYKRVAKAATTGYFRPFMWNAAAIGSIVGLIVLFMGNVFMAIPCSQREDKYNGPNCMDFDGWEYLYVPALCVLAVPLVFQFIQFAFARADYHRPNRKWY